MTQATGKPLGYYGVDTSLPEIQKLQAAYGVELENFEPAKLHSTALIALGEILQQDSEASIELQQSVNLSILFGRLYKQGGREQIVALLKFIVDRL